MAGSIRFLTQCLMHVQSAVSQDCAWCREAKVDELLAERAALQQELDQQKEHHAKAQQHLRVSPDYV